jgi:hypothetical protein
LLTSPFVEFYFYAREYERGAYPPDADAILIPVHWFTMGLLMMSPFILGALWLCVRRYPGRVSLFVWPERAPWWYWLASAAIGALVLMEVFQTSWTPLSSRWLDGVQSIVTSHLLLILRASLVGSVRATAT